MKVKKIPMRSCVVTREKLPQKELIRVVRTPEGVVVDTTFKINGRGAYLKKEREVFIKAKQKKILDKVLETNVPDGVFDELDKLI